MEEKLASISQPLALGDVPGSWYIPDFLSAASAVQLQQRLVEQVPWRQEQIRLYGRTVTVPRQVAWCGDSGVSYSYSGRMHTAGGWFSQLQALARTLEGLLNQPFNFALLNRYRNGQDHMGWHTDDEADVQGAIASVSLGASRGFLLRMPGESRSRRLLLEHGSLLVFDRRIRHCLPKRVNAGERINITFRSIEPTVQRP
jgi:alkylated DNA repair dioxygenase AlkB